MINVWTKIDKEFDCANMTFTRSIVHRSLSILVLPIYIISAKIDEKLDDLVVSFATRVKYSSLLKQVFFAWVYTEVCEQFYHTNGDGFVWDDASGEYKRLTKIFWLVKDSTHVDAMFLDKAGNFIHITFLNFIKESSMKWIEFTWANLRLRVELVFRDWFRAYHLLCELIFTNMGIYRHIVLWETVASIYGNWFNSW